MSHLILPGRRVATGSPRPLCASGASAIPPQIVRIVRATRGVYLRIYSNQSEASSTDFLRRLKRAAPLKILTDNGSQFTDRFSSKNKAHSGHHVFARECALLCIAPCLIKPHPPQTHGRVERFNGRISDLLATLLFRSREDLQTTLERYEKLYNEYLLATKRPGKRSVPGAKSDLNSLLDVQIISRDWTIT